MAVIDNLVSYWSFDAASGGESDLKGTNTLTEHGTMGTAAGKVGTSRSSDGGLNYLDVATNSSVQLGDVDFAYAGWVLFDDTGVDRDFVTKWEYTTPSKEAFFRRNTSNRIVFSISSDGTAEVNLSDTSFTTSTATWYFVVGQHDSVNNLVKICTNDGTVFTTAHSAGVFVGTSALQFGVLRNGDVRHLGRLDEWGFWKGRILSSADITWLYNAGAGRSYADLVLEAGAVSYTVIGRTVLDYD